MVPPMRTTIVVIMAALVAAGCAKKEESATVSDAGQAPSAVTTASAPPAHPSAAPTPRPPEPRLGWSDPQGWTRRTPANITRMTQYTVPHAPADKEDGECVITTFGGRMGGMSAGPGVEANIERWTRQFETDAGGVTPKQTTREVNGMKVTRVELTGTYRGMMMTGAPAQPKTGYKLLGAIVETPSGLWFFKMTGPAATVKAATKTFDDMIASIHAVDTTAPNAAPSGAPSAAQPGAAASGAPATH
jgi:hypothetical protein